MIRRRKLIQQDRLGNWLVSTVLLPDGRFETMQFGRDGTGSDWNYGDPYETIHSASEKEAIRVHNRVCKAVRKSIRVCRREYREEERIYPPYVYDNQ